MPSYIKKYLILTVCVILLCSLAAGCSSAPAGEPLTPYSAIGMTISLPDGFEETVLTGSTVTYEMEGIIVTLMKIPFSQVGDLKDSSAEEFGRTTLLNSALGSEVKLEVKNGVPGFDFVQTNPQYEQDYHHYVKVYKSDKSFWLFQFIAPVDQAEAYGARFETWAQSVRFD